MRRGTAFATSATKERAVPESPPECPPTGWGPFDREHDDVVETVRALLDAVNADDVERTRGAAQELLRKVGAHFAHEERLMREQAYPQLAQHEEAHQLYLADVAAFAREVAERGITKEFRRWSAGRGVEWFRLHVSTNDVPLGAFLAARERG
jgi:hemerythrin-like metal-binding protein